MSQYCETCGHKFSDVCGSCTTLDGVPVYYSEKEINMNVYRVRYLFTWFKELKDRYQESMWVSMSEDIDTIKREFRATICLNGELVAHDVKIIEIIPLGHLIEKNNGTLGVKYDFA